MSVIHVPEKTKLDARLGGFLAIVWIALIVFFGRLWYLQVVEADDLETKATTLRTVAVRRLAPRGLIYDRNGALIGGVQPKWVVTAVPFQINRNPWVLDKLATMLQIDRSKLEAELKENGWRPHFPVPIHVGASVTVASRIAESSAYLPGIDVDTQPMRSYADTLHFSHVMGYVWTPSASDVDRLKTEDADIPDYVGKDGLERVYEKLLQGKRGLDRYEVDSKRRPKRAVERRAPMPGKRMILSLDSTLQKRAAELLQGRKGAVVALDPSNGEVLCLVSSPGFDTVLFEGGIDRATYDSIAKDPSFPLMNRAVGGAYPPGSTFKIVTALAAQLAGTFNPYRTVNCPGFHQLGKKKTKCLGVHRAVAFHRAFEKSCNTYFATIGREAGIDNLRKAAKMLGLGEKMGIDLPSESKGTFPFEEWLNRPKTPRPFYPGDVVNTSIGQGYVQTTPLQMACVAALVANQGVAYRPHLVHAFIDPGQSTGSQIVERKELARVEVSREFWTTLRRAMVSVVDSGTATVARIPGLRWGGKTGSSEHRIGAKTHGWFVGVAPMEDPKIAVAVVVEALGHGGDVAAPIAKGVIQYYCVERLKPVKATSNAPSNSANSSSVTGTGP